MVPDPGVRVRLDVVQQPLALRIHVQRARAEGA
jgi:hypothetical protein